MNDISQPAAATPRRSYPTVREATEFETTAYKFDGKGNVEPIDFEHGLLQGVGYRLVDSGLRISTQAQTRI